MNRELRRKNKTNKQEQIEYLTYTIKMLEEFNQLSDEDRILSIEELKKELEKLEKNL